MKFDVEMVFTEQEIRDMLLEQADSEEILKFVVNLIRGCENPVLTRELITKLEKLAKKQAVTE